MRAPERGAALVEATIVLPILLFLMFSIIEMGGVMRSYSGTASAVRHGGRTASLAGADPMSDARILEEVAGELESTGDDEVLLVVIWHAEGPGDTVPLACLPVDLSTPNTSTVGDDGVAPGGIGACNVFVKPGATGGAFAMAGGVADQPADYYFGCAGPSDPDVSHKVDCMWPATTRQVLTSPRGSATPTATDFVGVYVRVRHDYYTGALGSSVTITDKSITLIEPQGYKLS